MAPRDDAEWKRFLADSWERGEAPTDDAWRRHVRRAAFEHLRQAQKLLDYLIEPDDDSVEGYEQAADEVVAMANRYLRLPPVPHVPPEAWESDEGISAAWAAREHELKVMPYGEYLRTPEWAEQRRRALRRADGRCETCARTQATTATSPSTRAEAVTEFTVRRFRPSAVGPVAADAALCAQGHRPHRRSRRAPRGHGARRNR